MNIKTIAIVTARGGSKGIKDKNLLPYAGLTLASKACFDGLNANCIDEVYICTDSEAIRDVCLSVGALSLGLRPQQYATDSSTDNDVLRSFCHRYHNANGNLPDYIVHLRPTSPQRTSQLIDNVYSDFFNHNSEFSSIRTFHTISGESLKLAKILDNGCMRPLSSPEIGSEIWGRPRQSLEQLAKGNGLVDILKSSVVLSELSHYGERVKGYLTPPCIDIDTLDDYNLALLNPSLAI